MHWSKLLQNNILVYSHFLANFRPPSFFQVTFSGIALYRQLLWRNIFALSIPHQKIAKEIVVKIIF